MPDSQIPAPDVQGEGESFSSVTISGLTASRLVAADATKTLESVSNLASWVAGTANQVVVADDGDGSITLSLPQSIHTGASPTFADLTLSNLTASRLLGTDGSSQLASVSDLTSWVAGTANQITSTDDGDGTLTLSLPSAVTLPGSLTVTTTLGVTGVTTVGGNIVSDTDSTDDLGTTLVRWANLYVDDVTVTDTLTFDTTTILQSDAANTLAQRNGTNAQVFRVYNTDDGAGNTEFMENRWTSNIIHIRTQVAGTGTHREMRIGTAGAANLTFQTAGSNRFRVDSNGHLLGVTDNTYDIGASGTTRPRTGYFGTALIVGTNTATHGSIRVANGGFISSRNAANNNNFTLVSGNSSNEVEIGRSSVCAGILLVPGTGNIVEQRNGASAQTFRAYGTFTDASNHENLQILMDTSNGGQITTENAGTGSARSLWFGAGGTLSWRINTSQHIITGADNTYDIGASGATRPRTGYFGTSVVAPTFTAATSVVTPALIPAGGIVTVTGDVNPEADGTRDLGIQTTAQWANVWSDLINGADIAMANKWRMVESELYPGYAKGWAIGHSKRWTDGKSLWVEAGGEHGIVEGERPTFAVTDEYLEYAGIRVTPEEFKKAFAK